MPRLSVPIDEDVFRALQFKAIAARRDVRDQAAHELERALVDVFRAAPPAETPAPKSGAPGQPCQAPGAPGKGEP